MNGVRFSAGTLGPLVFGVNLADSVAIIITFNILGVILPAYLQVQSWLLHITLITHSGITTVPLLVPNWG